MLRTSLLAFVALGLAACASTSDSGTSAAAGDRECFSSSQVSGYEVIDDNHVRVRVSANRNYILTTSWNARDLDWTHAIALRASPAGQICTGNGLGVELVGGDPQRTYPITNIAREPDPIPAGS